MSKYIDANHLKEKIYAEDTVSLAHGSSPEFDQGCHYAFLTVLSFLDSLQQEQPFLPDNLDEAAEEWCKRNNKGIALCGDKKSHYLAEGVDAFKAGAEWMAKQGFISEGIINQTSGEDTMIELNEYIDNLEDCEEVIVNIRKKQ